MKSFSSSLVLGMIHLALGAATASAATLASSELEVSKGPRLDVLDSRTLGARNSVTVTVESLVRSGREFSITGMWGERGNAAKALTRADADLVDFDLSLIREGGNTCSPLHVESAKLRIARGVNGDVRIIGATLSVELTFDACHFSAYEVTARLTPANDGACADSLASYLGMSVAMRDSTSGQRLVGFSSAAGYRYDGRTVGAALVMETPSSKFFYLETGGSSAELFRCEVASAQVASLKSGRQIGCGDLPAADRATATYINCN